MTSGRSHGHKSVLTLSAVLFRDTCPGKVAAWQADLDQGGVEFIGVIFI